MSKKGRIKINNFTGNLPSDISIKTTKMFNAALLWSKNKKDEIEIDYDNRNIEEDVHEKEELIQKREERKMELEKVFKNPKINKIDILPSLDSEIKKPKKQVFIKKRIIIPAKAKKEDKEDEKDKKDEELDIKNVPEKIKSLISVRGVDVKYNLGKESEYHAIKGVDLDIYSGEFIIFFGPSGCGKSTLVNVIAGLERPCKGDVTVDGEDILRYNYDQLADYHTKKIGMVFQAYNLIDSLSIADNIALPQMFMEEDKKVTKELVKELLQRFEIEKHAKKPPAMLSGGQQQRVGIARALVNNPRIVLADEPIGNLDSASAEIVVKIFKELNRRDKKTVLLVTHNPDLLPIANRIFHMKDGCIVREEIREDKRPEEARKKKVVEDDGIDIPKELKLLMRTYGNLTNSQLGIMWTPLKAKMIARRILQKYTLEQTEIIERAIRMRLTEVNDKKMLYEVLDMPLSKGGAGLDRRAAVSITNEVEKILEEVKKVRQYVKATKNNEVENEEMKIVIELRQQIMRFYHGHLLQENVDMLDEIIRKRLKNNIDKGEFISLVSKPTGEGGAGFNKRTAKTFSSELELLMLIKFGEEHK